MARQGSTTVIGHIGYFRSVILSRCAVKQAQNKAFLLPVNLNKVQTQAKVPAVQQTFYCSQQ